MGIQQSFYISFTFLRLKEMNAPSLVYGLNIAVGAMASASFFFAGRCVIDKLDVTWPAMTAGVFAYFIRYLAVAYTHGSYLLYNSYNHFVLDYF